MLGILTTKFVCTNCGSPVVLKSLSTTEIMEFIGVEICPCKGDPNKQPKKETNITSFSLEKEKRNQQKRKK